MGSACNIADVRSLMKICCWVEFQLHFRCRSLEQVDLILVIDSWLDLVGRRALMEMGLPDLSDLGFRSGDNGYRLLVGVDDSCHDRVEHASDHRRVKTKISSPLLVLLPAGDG
ncbi:hypothetical protein ACLOJK_027013 [Asimina triloba]